MKKFAKVCLTLLSLSLVGGTLASCGDFFGSDSYSIKDVVSTTDSEGNAVVTISFNENKDPVTFTVSKGVAGKDGVGIASVTGKTSEDGKSVILTITFTDASVAPVTITVPVVNGKDGKGVASVSVSTDTNGNKVLVFGYTDGTKSDPIVIPKGNDGVGIASITHETQTDGSTLITVTFTDSTIAPTTFVIPKGNDGVSIASIVSSLDGADYVLTITFSDGVTQEIRFAKPTCNNWLSGTADPGSGEGSDGDFFFNTSTGDIFKKSGGTWSFIVRLWQNSVYYYVKFNPNGGTVGGSGDVYQQKVKAGECLSDLDTPVFAGKVFEGWWTSVDATDPNAGHLTVITPIFTNMTVYARWGA